MEKKCNCNKNHEDNCSNSKIYEKPVSDFCHTGGYPNYELCGDKVMLYDEEITTPQDTVIDVIKFLKSSNKCDESYSDLKPIEKCGANYNDLKPNGDNLLLNRQLDGGRMGLKDDSVNTNLISKDYSPLIVRKYNIVRGWPMYVGIICDENLSDLDIVVNKAFKEFKDAGLMTNNIQNFRNFTGYVSESITNYFNSKKENCVEGVAIFLYIDKLAISSCYGDLMSFQKCALEFYHVLDLMTKH